MIYFHNGRLDVAKEYILRTVALAPNFIEGRFNLALVERALKKNSEAVAHLREVTARNPAHTDSHLLLAEIMCNSGNLQEALSSAEIAATLSPANPKAQGILGKILLASGQIDNAVIHLGNAIAANPADDIAHNALGSAYLLKNEPEKALRSFKNAASANPANLEVHLNIAAILHSANRLADAIDHYRTHLVLRADDAQTFFSLGNALMELGRLEEAASSYKSAVRANPEFIEANNNLGNVLRGLGRHGEALEHYRAALELDPTNTTIQHAIAALTGQRPVYVPHDHIEKTFDALADRFDQYLVEKLHYESPRMLTKLIDACKAPTVTGWDVLDLGCGTGLMGEAIGPRARRICGIDLSSKMLAKAREKNLYNRLEQRDLLSWMREEAPSSYDVVVAADVFVYLGELDDVIGMTHSVLKPGGILVFSVEALDTETSHVEAETAFSDYAIGKSGRYCHSKEYVLALAIKHGFQTASVETHQARIEGGKAVMAWYVALLKTVSKD